MPPPSEDAAPAAMPEITLTNTDNHDEPGGTTAHNGAYESAEELPSDADEEARLKMLTTGTRAQDDLERDIGRQADQMMTEQADARDKKAYRKARG